MQILTTKNTARVFLYAVLFLLVWLCYLGYEIISFRANSTVASSEVAIVLGAAVWGDKPSPVFEERINHAIKLYNKQIVKKIIFTGGMGEAKKHTESEVAKSYAIKQDVAVEDILVETNSRTTIQNLRESKTLVKVHAFKSIILVSDPLHMKRSVRIARDMGMQVYPSPTMTSRYHSFYSQTNFFLREIYFYQRYLLIGI